MSGLFGYVSQSAGYDAIQVATCMGERMRHHDHYCIDICPIPAPGAFGRIGIGLLNAGPQPVWGADGSVALLLCGELYHHERKLRDLQSHGMLAVDADDADYALHLYLAGGVSALTLLDGMFIVAVWDGRSGDLCLVNDRFGLYPHYYAHTGGAFAWAPEITSVLTAPGIRRTLDEVAVAQYTRFQQLLGERTWFQDVHLLPPATVLHYRPAGDSLSLERYWDWDRIAPQPSNISLGDAADETIRLFQRAIDARIRPPLRVGVFLSGGLDGRAILGFARDRTPIATFTFGAPGCRDVHVAEQIARRSGARHQWFPLEDGTWVLEHAERHLELTEGMHSWMHSHGMSVLSEARQTVDVNLSGWDGGTILGGFMVAHGGDGPFRHPLDEPARERAFLTGFCSEFAWPGLTDMEAESLFRPPGNPQLYSLAFDSLREELARTAHYPDPYRADYFYLAQHCRRSTQNMIVFARSAIEVRCPYFDYELVSFLYGLPERLRTSLDLQHLVITRRMPDLARIPNEKDNLPPHSSRPLRTTHRVVQKGRRMANRLTPRLPDRPRLYADYENYLRCELAGWAEEILLDPLTLERGFFNPSAVRELWERHKRGDELWTIGKVAPLITLELVLRYFSDEGTEVNAPLLQA